VELFKYCAMSKIIFKPKYIEKDKVFEEKNIYRDHLKKSGAFMIWRCIKKKFS